MFAAHFAAGVAIKSIVPETPIRPLLAAVFLPDFVWIALATVGVEPTAPARFFDGWSHSLLMVLLYGGTLAWLFRRDGSAVAAALFVGVVSHFVLDLPIHPRPLELYPHSGFRFDLAIAPVAPMRYWVVQLAVTVALLAVYVFGMLRHRAPRGRIAQTCFGIIGLHIILLPG